LASFLAGGRVDDDARSYDLVLPEVEKLLSNVNAYESLWRDGWNSVAHALESFSSGDSRVAEHEESRISLITLAPDLSQWLMAVSKHARGEMFLIATPAAGGWTYRLDYPYYAWAETVVRPEIPRRDLTNRLAMLNEKEQAGLWRIDKTEMTSAAKFFNADGTLGVSHLQPDEVLAVLSTKPKVQSTNL